MPYYECPRCGSKDHYMGTEIVSDGRGAIMESPVEGMYISAKASDKKVSVPRCKKCDTLLSEKDKRETENEAKRRRAQETAQHKENAKANKIAKLAVELGAHKGESGCFSWIVSLGIIWGCGVEFANRDSVNEWNDVRKNQRMVAKYGSEHKEDLELSKYIWEQAGRPSRFESMLFGRVFSDPPAIITENAPFNYEHVWQFEQYPPKKIGWIERLYVPILSLFPIIVIFRHVIYSGTRSAAWKEAKKRYSAEKNRENKEKNSKSNKGNTPESLGKKERSSKAVKRSKDKNQLEVDKQIAEIKAKRLAKTGKKKTSVKTKGVSRLGKCPDCEKEISKRAPSCPHCGCPEPFG